ncbi:MAG: polyisoprenoid-binding protein [Candidatus Kapaibacterium sp.]|nr:MAG: polyisoprenoid-binding protein [Candidatus Kapabacteria bacterium]
MRAVRTLAIVVAASASLFAQGAAWKVDQSHSNVLFTVDHMVISEVTGYFKVFDGTVTVSKPDWSDAQIEFTVDVASINTDNERRDNHLRSEDFFDAAKYPKATFKATGMRKVGQNKYKLTGDLTIRGTTKKVTWDVTFKGQTKDPWGNLRAGFIAETTINRFDFGLKWNNLTETGGLIVGKDVRVRVNLELIKQDASKSSSK